MTKAAWIYLRLRSCPSIRHRRFVSNTNVDQKDVGNVRVRFAPSPTGFLHLGGLRSIVYNYIFAKSHPNGRFILRIEDTDRDRTLPGAAENIETTLSWLGMEPDESPMKGGPCGPYVQSQRLDIYRDAVKTLLDAGKAYRCFCTKDRLMLMKKEALKNREDVRYDNRCRSLTPEEIDQKLRIGLPFGVRFLLRDEPSSFTDAVFDRYKYEVHIHEGDPVILKSDGYPTYHLANVVDDHRMRITHVIRGEEWLQSTTKHLQLYSAFDWTPPTFAHLPLMRGQKGGKLSKRDAASNLETYKEAGYYPLALINFVLSTGGGFDPSKKEKNRIYSLDELIDMFRMDKVLSRGTKVEPDYLDKYNRQYMTKMIPRSELIEDLRRLISTKLDRRKAERILESEPLDDAYLERILDQYLREERVTTLIQLLTSPDHAFLWTYDLNLHPDLRKPVTAHGQTVTPKEMAQHLEKLAHEFEAKFDDADYTTDELKKFLTDFELKSALNHRLMLPFIRLLITHTKQGLPVAEMFFLFGKERVIRRLKRGIEQLKTASEENLKIVSV